MNDEYNRMKGLIKSAGINFSDGGYTDAEIDAWSQGLEQVKRLFSETEAAVFFTLASDGPIGYYADLLGIDTQLYSKSECQDRIFRRMAHSYGDYTAGDFEREFAEIQSGNVELADCGVDDYFDLYTDDLLFSDFDFAYLSRLGRFIEAFSHLCGRTLYDGNGLYFDEWDRWAISWNQYDDLHLPFDITDHLRR